MSGTARYDVMSERVLLLRELRSVLIEIPVSRYDKECVCMLQPKCRRSFLPPLSGNCEKRKLLAPITAVGNDLRGDYVFVSQTLLLATAQLVAFSLNFVQKFVTVMCKSIYAYIWQHCIRFLKNYTRSNILFCICFYKISLSWLYCKPYMLLCCKTNQLVVSDWIGVV